MLNLAGKFANVISRNPVASSVAGGLGAAGLATLGNIVSGEALEESPARLGAEALGAGALGAIVGSGIPFIRGTAARTLKRIGAVSGSSPGAKARRASMSPGDIKTAEFARDLLSATARSGVDARQLTEDLKTNLRTQQRYANAAGVPLTLLAGGALGGMLGGGVANAAGAVGIPGFQQGAVDPESYSSSNTDLARMSVPTLQYM